MPDMGQLCFRDKLPLTQRDEKFTMLGFEEKRVVYLGKEQWAVYLSS